MLALAVLLPLWAQSSSVLSVGTISKLTVKRNSPVEVRVPFVLQPGYHTNSNTPSESYLIPLRLTWEPGLLEAGEIIYPKPQLEKYEFADKPLSVFSGTFEVTTKFRVPAAAMSGPGQIAGKLRYQACNDKVCLPPKTIEVKVPVVVQ